MKDKYDLIIPNASLQLCNDIYKTISDLSEFLNPAGILAFSIFGDKNLKEIKEFFDIENLFIDKNLLSERCNMLKYASEEIRIYFNEPIDIIRHFKLTGVNARGKINKIKVKEF